MATTLWPQIVDALVAACRAQVGYYDPGAAAGSGIPVYDGTEIALTNEPAQQYLVIGWSGDPDRPQDAGRSAQDPGPMSTLVRARDELGTVECLAVSQPGDASIGARSVKTSRDAAYQIMATVEQICRGTAVGPTLGISNNLWAFVTQHSVQQYLDEGAVCEISFTVSYRARL